jgi:hypothetical protein
VEKDNHPAGAATSRDPITRAATVANGAFLKFWKERGRNRYSRLRGSMISLLKISGFAPASGTVGKNGEADQNEKGDKNYYHGEFDGDKEEPGSGQQLSQQRCDQNHQRRNSAKFRKNSQ